MRLFCRLMSKLSADVETVGGLSAERFFFGATLEIDALLDIGPLTWGFVEKGDRELALYWCNMHPIGSVGT